MTMRQLLMVLLSAGLLFLATPPNTIWPLALIALVPLLAVSAEAEPRKAALLGWLTGTTYYLLSCTWWYPILTRAFDWSPIIIVALYLLLNAWHGLVFGLGTGAVSLLRRRFGLHVVLSAPLAFAVVEAVMPAVFKGYIGTTVWRAWPLIQFAEIGGPPAVSAVVVLVNAVLLGLLVGLRRRKMPDPPVRLGALVLVLLVGAGYLRGQWVDSRRHEVPAHRFGLVQVNSSMYSRADNPNWSQQLLRALGRETLVHLANGADLVIWPESIWPGVIARPATGSAAPEFLRTLLTGFDGKLLFGGITEDADGVRRNSALLLSNRGQVEAIADKSRLVPFFESAPLGDLIPGWSELLQSLTGRDRPFLSAAEEPAIIESGSLRIGVLFCSEEMLLDYPQELARQDPNLLVGVVSDYYVRDTSAVAQHLALAAFRAVETRRDLVHVTDSGISAMVDGSGRVQLVAPSASTEPVTALSAEARPLELFSPGPYVAHLFPFAAAAVLGLAAFLRWAPSARGNRRWWIQDLWAIAVEDVWDVVWDAVSDDD